MTHPWEGQPHTPSSPPLPSPFLPRLQAVPSDSPLPAPEITGRLFSWGCLSQMKGRGSGRSPGRWEGPALGSGRRPLRVLFQAPGGLLSIWRTKAGILLQKSYQAIDS